MHKNTISVMFLFIYIQYFTVLVSNNIFIYNQAIYVTGNIERLQCFDSFRSVQELLEVIVICYSITVLRTSPEYLIMVCAVVGFLEGVGYFIVI